MCFGSPVCPLLHLLSVNKGKEAQQEMSYCALTSSLYFASLMLLAASKQSLHSCSGVLQFARSKSEVSGLEERMGIF